MKRTRLTIDELLEELRSQGCTDLSTVEYAILETNGMLSLLLYPDQRPPCAKDMGLSVSGGGLPAIIVSDGHLIQRNLTERGYDQNWLDHQLTQQGVTAVKDIFLLTVDESGAVYCVPRGIANDGGT